MFLLFFCWCKSNLSIKPIGKLRQTINFVIKTWNNYQILGVNISLNIMEMFWNGFYYQSNQKKIKTDKKPLLKGLNFECYMYPTFHKISITEKGSDIASSRKETKGISRNLVSIFFVNIKKIKKNVNVIQRLGFQLFT